MHYATYSPEDNKIRIYPDGRLDSVDYDTVKSAGFIWAPNQKIFVAPMWTPAREDAAIALCGEIGDDDTSLVERAEDRAERFNEYSDNRAEDADRARQAVETITDFIPMGQPILIGHHSERRARKDAERIENGMRHAVKMWETAEYWKRRASGAIRAAKYKERPDVRYRRIKGLEADYRKQDLIIVDCRDFLKLWSFEPIGWKRAKVISNHYKCNVSRCYTLAEFPRELPRKQYEGEMSLWSALGDSPEEAVITPEQAREIATRSLTGTMQYAQRWLTHVENRIAYERAMLDDSGGIVAEQAEIAIGGRVLVAGEWVRVLRINKKDGKQVSFSTSRKYCKVVGVEEVKGYEPPSAEEAKQTADAMKKAPLCNYPRADFATCTREVWAKIGSDYKGSDTIEATDDTAAHRVRRAQGYYLNVPDCAKKNDQYWKSSYYWVFITDDKQKDAPAIAMQTPPPAISPELFRNEPDPAAVERRHAAQMARQEPNPQAELFGALKETLRAGIKTVNAPQLFPTPPSLAARMADAADIQPGQEVLEPSAGTGNLCRAIKDAEPTARVFAVEINHKLCELLSQTITPPEDAAQGISKNVLQGDFLELNGELGTFDRVVMNPPFQNGEDIKHIQHARHYLKPGGRLVALCANGPRQQAILKPLAELSGGWWEDLPAGTFAEQGTGVNTALLVIEKGA